MKFFLSMTLLLALLLVILTGCTGRGKVSDDKDGQIGRETLEDWVDDLTDSMTTTEARKKATDWENGRGETDDRTDDESETDSAVRTRRITRRR